MERFIAYKALIVFASKIFKIQYGEIYRQVGIDIKINYCIFKIQYGEIYS